MGNYCCTGRDQNYLKKPPVLYKKNLTSQSFKSLSDNQNSQNISPIDSANISPIKKSSDENIYFTFSDSIIEKETSLKKYKKFKNNNIETKINSIIKNHKKYNLFDEEFVVEFFEIETQMKKNFEDECDFFFFNK